MPFRPLQVFLLASIAVANAAFAQLGGAPPPDPREILQRSKEASGGKAWDALRSQHSKVKIQAAGLTGAAYSVGLWSVAAYGALNPEVTLRIVAPSATAMIVALQLIFSSFFLGVLGLRRQ